MPIEQTLRILPYLPVRSVEQLKDSRWDKDVSPNALRFIRKWMGLPGHNDLVLLADPDHPDFQLLAREAEERVSISRHALCTKRLNQVQHLNKYLQIVNESMEVGGHFIGRLETSYNRKSRILQTYFVPLNRLIYLFDYLLFRVWPKMPFLRQFFFFLFSRHNRAIPEMEMLGRLYYCGFKLIDSMETDGEFYFVVEKVKAPEYNRKPDCGPLIRLRRNGKGGKPIFVYKFRTMFSYAEFLQQHVYERNGLAKGGKIEKDPRLNAAGFILRKYWLDELPMFLNLVNGDLKIFGVRPISYQYLSLYPPEAQAFRKQFKPGLIPPFYADLPVTFDEIVESEMRYLKAYQRSPLLTDLRYGIKAVRNILFRKRAATDCESIVA